MKFIYGPESYWLNQLSEEYCKNFINNVVEFDNNYALEEIIQEIMTLPMFFTEKLIVIKNHECFEDWKIGEQIAKIIKNKYSGLNFLFIFETSNLDRKNPLVVYLLSHAEVNEVKKLDEKSVVKEIKKIVNARGGTISNIAAIKLSIKLPANLWIIVNELEKLLVNNLDITEEFVDQATNDYTKDNFFALSNAILARDYHSIIRSYYDRKKLGDDETFIIAQIANVLEVAIIVNSYRKQGLSNTEIAKKTKIHLFRVKKGHELIELVGEAKVKNLLNDLSTLDFLIKMGKVEKTIGLDQFIIKLLQ